MYGGGVPVACRTRSKRGRVVGSGLVTRQKKKRLHRVIFLEGEGEGASVVNSSSSSSSLKRGRVSERGFDCLGGHAGNPIEIGDSDDEKDKGCSVFHDIVENPVILPDEKERGDGVDIKSASKSNDDEHDSFLSLMTSDEDFQVENDCYSSSGSSSDDDDDYERREGYRKTVKERVSETESSKEEAIRKVESVNADAQAFGDHCWDSSGCSMPSEAEALEHTKHRRRDRDHQSASLQKKTKYLTVMINKSDKNIDVNANDCVNLDERVSLLPKSQEKIGDSAKVVIKNDKKGRERKYNEKVRVVADESTGDKDELHELLRIPSRTNNRCFKYFNESFWVKNDSVKDHSNQLEEKDDDVKGQGQTQPLASRETVPLNWNFMKKKTNEKSESEKELDILWDEMDMLLRAEEIGSQVDNIGANEARENEENPASQCKHDTIFNEEIGIYCRWCGWIATEIKYITPPFVDSERCRRRRVSSGGGMNTSQFDGGDLFNFNDSGDELEAVWSHNEGTVWDLIPDIKQSLYPHQQEGFEFIWTNLTGTTDLAKLKRVDPCSEGGCIVSHAPGTGKTRLTMVFLQTYLQLFPKCLPIIIAPANILLTWEDELRKWNIGIPFHNLNNSSELSGKENLYANQRQNKDAIRMVKLCSWYKEKSILLISYNLYEKLAGATSEGDGEKEKKNRKMKKKKKCARTREYIESGMGKVLRDYPGLLVLDEGHTPRNQNSYIWKVLSESKTPKRILLSGTPFQNNLLELYNILCLMKPSFPDSIPQELKKFFQSRLMQERKASKYATNWDWAPVSSGNTAGEKINQLKLLMNPFVHVHKGSILQKNLPGLRDCVLVLKPDSLQQETLQSIECSQSALNFEHKLALVSVHPSLFLNCSLSKKEESLVDKDKLEKLRMNPYGGVKTKFLIELIRLCDAVNEKVLVFSQFIDTLCLVKDQLESAFNWSVGTEVLYMYGSLDQKQKQSLIHSFNDSNSQAKVLLASIKASSEGINLVGASRVVLLDVVWNPSVERQAICRAYRLGQKRVVFTYHLLAQGTPECTKYCKQAEKNRLSELVFSNRNAESDNKHKSGVMSEDIEDRILDLMVQHKKLKDMFGECLVQPKEGP